MASSPLGPDQGVADAHFEISVSLSGCQLQQPRLTDVVQRALENTGLSAHQLVLEVTESTAMADVQVPLEGLRRLKALGVRLAIDDFGTGYSSLSHLKHFPIDILKIDRSFISGPGADAQDEAIIRSVIALARSLQLSVIAEGIETADQHALLRSLGCEKGQGFLMGRPVHAQQVSTAAVAGLPESRRRYAASARPRAVYLFQPCCVRCPRRVRC